MIATAHLTASCSCGSIEFKAFGAPIVSNVCYCDDCQKGSRQIEELSSATPVRDPYGGTAYILYRKDRIECSTGVALLKSYKIKENSVTNRVVDVGESVGRLGGFGHEHPCHDYHCQHITAVIQCSAWVSGVYRPIRLRLIDHSHSDCHST